MCTPGPFVCFCDCPLDLKPGESWRLLTRSGEVMSEGRLINPLGRATEHTFSSAIETALNHGGLTEKFQCSGGEWLEFRPLDNQTQYFRLGPSGRWAFSASKSQLAMA